MLKYTPFQSSVFFFFLTYPQSCVTVITLTLEHFKILPQSPTHISTHYPFFFCKASDYSKMLNQYFAKIYFHTF